MAVRLLLFEDGFSDRCLADMDVRIEFTSLKVCVSQVEALGEDEFRSVDGFRSEGALALFDINGVLSDLLHVCVGVAELVHGSACPFSLFAT